MNMLVHGNALLALMAAALWGGGDFSGGMGVKNAGGSMGSALRHGMITETRGAMCRT